MTIQAAKRAIAASALALALASCGGGQGAGGPGGPGGPGGQMPPAEVGFVVVQPTSVPLTTELAARTAAFETSEVRPQVSGLIRRRFFTEGSYVRAGQTLYQIDPRTYAASVSQARANLSAAAAQLEAARIRSERYRPLAQQEAVSKQDYTDAVAQARQAQASVAQNRAALESANVSLGFTRVPAPISGRIGRSLATVGALVTSNQAEPLAVIQRLDPMYVDIQQSSANLLALRRSLSQGNVVPASAAVRLRLEDGSDYGYAGTVQFSEVTVDEGTGTVTLRASFPNPQGLLLPGMFVRALFAQAVDQNAFLIPQAAVTRDPKGAATVKVVGAGNKVEVRNITTQRTQGAFWVVTNGIRPGDKVITEGTAKAMPGMQVNPVPAGTRQRIAPPPDPSKAGGQAPKKG